MLEYFWGSIVSIATFVTVIMAKGFCSHTINSIASSTMGIFLISENSLLGVPLWTKFIPLQNYIDSSFYILIIISLVICVFTICLLIDKIKVFLLKCLKGPIDKVFQLVDKNINKCMSLMEKI